jgi:hypothetical protein
MIESRVVLEGEHQVWHEQHLNLDVGKTHGGPQYSFFGNYGGELWLRF